jgi:hypothetical protein
MDKRDGERWKMRGGNNDNDIFALENVNSRAEANVDAGEVESDSWNAEG